MWSSNSGHEHNVCGHKYPMVFFGTLGLGYIKTHIYKVWKLKKDLLFNFDHTQHSSFLAAFIV